MMEHSVLTPYTTVLMRFIFFLSIANKPGSCHGCDRMVVDIITTYAISAYHH